MELWDQQFPKLEGYILYILRGFSHNQESTTCGGVERKLGKGSVQNVCATDKDVAKPEKGSQIIHMATWDGSCVSKQSVTCLCEGTDVQHEGFRQTQSGNIWFYCCERHTSVPNAAWAI